MSLFGTKEKQEIELLKKEAESLKAKIELLKEKNSELNAIIPEDGFDLNKLKKEVSSEKKSLDKIKQQIKEAKAKLKDLSREVVETEETIMFQSFGLYTPRYDFLKSDDYKARLLENRAKQKEMIKEKTAVRGASGWSVNGSEAQGKKMVSDMQKLLLRAFNAECDDIVEHVKYNNIESSEKRITASREAISKLGTIMQISINTGYYRLKIEELYLAFEYQQKKQEEKDAQKEARAEMREAAKLAKELEDARKKLEKEQTHYQNALTKVNAQLAKATDADRAAIEAKKAEIEEQLQKIGAEFEAVDYREANQKAGYVYIISNIGAFGENVFKIGMTRRLDPMERIDELGDASVPFDFDVHAMIFSKDAPKLESALHNAFADRKLNFVNTRREFFNVSLEEIRDVVKANYDRSVEFTELAPAEQFRQSILLRESGSRVSRQI